MQKFIIEFVPALGFFIYYYLTKDLVVATGILVFLTILSFAVSYFWFKKIEPILWFMLVFVVSFGGATLILHDDFFVKIKSTVISLVLATIFLANNFVYKDKPILKVFLGSKIKLPIDKWRILSHMWLGFFIFSGLLNLLILYLFSEEIWVYYKTWGGLVIAILFSVLQGIYLFKHLKK